MANYDFSSLSPVDFELMVRDLLKEEYDWNVEAFGQGPDGGIDLRAHHAGQLVVVQCKHYAGSRFSDLMRSARDEKKKVDGWAPWRYLFVTSQDLTRGQKDKLIEELTPWIKLPTDLICKTDLNALLDKYPKVEQRNFKLWLASVRIIERIVNNQTWERSEALMEDVQDRVRLYVSNPSYRRASETLANMHSVVITGSPGVGKSMLAEMLLLTHWQEGWQVVRISSDIEEGWHLWVRERPQVFYFDDFLGQTDVSELLSGNRAAGLESFVARIQKNPLKRLVMTTRRHVLRQAELRYEVVARMDTEFRECLLLLDDYGPLEKARILYNHLYFSGLDRRIIRDYVSEEYYWRVISHPNFTPRIVQQVLKRALISADELNSSLLAALDRPMNLWGGSFENSLSDVARRVLIALVSFPVDGVHGELLRRAAIRDASPLDYTNSLRVLEGSWIEIQDSSSRRSHIVFKDPSCRDFILALLDQEPDYALDILINAPVIEMKVGVLGYANSQVVTDSGSAEYKYPNLTAAVRQSADRVSLSIVDGWSAALARQQSGLRPGRNLVRLLEYGSLLMGRLNKWVLGEALKLSTEEYERYHTSGTTINQLVNALVEDCGGVHLIAPESEFGDLVVLWAESVEDEEELRAADSFINKVRDAEYDWLDRADEALIAQAREIIGALLEEVTSDLDDPGDMFQDLDNLRTLARDLGIESQLHNDFAYTESSINEYEPRDKYDYSPRAAASAVSSRGSQTTARGLTSRAKAEITDMFNNLG